VAADTSVSVQIFGFRDSRPTQQAIRFFRDRRIQVIFVDLAQRPIARGELQRFSQKFGALGMLDQTGKAFADAGLGYMRLDESDAFERALANPRLLRLPLARAGVRLSIGVDETAWRDWVNAK